MKVLLETVKRHKAGEAVGIYSVCSAHSVVIEAACELARMRGTALLIEATSNQVNQFGGYTGMAPKDFRRYATEIAELRQLPKERLLLGGDHLGPNAWQKEASATAMRHAADMIHAYVAAGFRKIHLDCSMSCADDPPRLADEVIAGRAAELCKVAEKAWAESGGEAPVYVVGTEVPTPGGAHEDLGQLAVTTPAAVTVTLDAHRQAFKDHGLSEVWPRVIALVVQPGVEFDHDKVIDYAPERAVSLSRRIESEPDLVFEAHSTDYQKPGALKSLVEDHFAILKVGPGVTFALRETLWALADVASELGYAEGGALKRTVLKSMADNPAHWRSYYTDAARQRFDMQYSLSDRIRYYWSVPEVQTAVAALVKRLSGAPLPLSLLSQYLPLQFAAVREGRLENAAGVILRDGVAEVLRHYASACEPGAGR